MIGKIKRGKSFAGVCDYVLRENKQVVGRIIGGNMAGQTSPELTREFELLASLNTRVRVPVKHFSLSFAEQDGIVSDDMKHLMAMDYMEQMGYGNSHYVVVSHDRTDHDHAHDHIHIVASSVAMDGTWVNDRLDWKRSQTVLRALESEHDLTPVASSWDKDRDKSLAAKLGCRVERASHGKVELSEIERTHAEIQSKIELAAMGATSMTQFCARLQVLEIDPIAKITRTGKVQGISYRSGDAVVRGSDLKSASFPALQQRGIKFNPARDVANLKSAVKGERLEVDREWLENSTMTSEAENLAVTAKLVFTHSEILIIPIVTTENEVTPPKKPDRVQERKDADLLYVAAEYPDLKQTPEYQAAAKRAKERYQERLKSMPKQAPIPAAVVPTSKKWEPTWHQATNPELVDSIRAAAAQLGADGYQIDNYRVRLLDRLIEIDYRSKLAMTIDLTDDLPQSQLIDSTHTLNQYERALGGAISEVLTDLLHQQEADRDREIQHQLELQHERERQQAQERQQELERTLYPNVDFSDPSPNIDFSEPTPDRDRSGDYGWSR